MIPFKSIAYGIALCLAAATSTQANDGKFETAGSQLALLAKSLLAREGLGAHKKLCTRYFFTRDELLEHPLGKEKYEILKTRQKAMVREEGNSFPFENGDDPPWSCPNDHGYCMGLSTFARDLNLLLWFDPKTPLKFQTPEEKVRYLEDILFDAWSRRRPAIVPGYANLKEFGTDPVVLEILMRAIPKAWAELAAIPAITFGVVREASKGISLAEVKTRIAYLQTRLEYGYYPLIHLGGRDESVYNFASTMVKERIDLALESRHLYIHVVQLDRIEKISDRKWIFHVIDPNMPWPENVGKLTIDLDSEKNRLYYHGATAEQRLQAFGELPSDRITMDEIVLETFDFLEQAKDRLPDLLK